MSLWPLLNGIVVCICHVCNSNVDAIFQSVFCAHVSTIGCYLSLLVTCKSNNNIFSMCNYVCAGACVRACCVRVVGHVMYLKPTRRTHWCDFHIPGGLDVHVLDCWHDASQRVLLSHTWHMVPAVPAVRLYLPLRLLPMQHGFSKLGHTGG